MGEELAHSGLEKISFFNSEFAKELGNSRLIIFIDLDNVLGHKFRAETKGLTSFQKKQLKAIGRLTSRLKEKRVACVLCTGRQAGSLTAEGDQSILRLTNIGIALCENTGVLLTDFGQTKSLILSGSNKEVLQGLRQKFGAYEQMAKETMVTILIPDEKRRDREERERFAQEIKKRLSREQQEMIERGSLKMVVSNNAVDFCFVDKSRVGWFCEKLGIEREKRMAIGDSESDLAMMQACQYAACPKNASKNVKDYVGEKKKKWVCGRFNRSCWNSRNII